MHSLSQEITTIFTLIAICIGFRFLLELFGQRWITTLAHTATLTLLPIITYVITKVISGNIALSLGMVGALSIVRFRHPVRSPFELAIYFAGITMGISAAVNIKWMFFFVASILAATISLFLVSIISNKLFNHPFFITSFSEGNSLSTLEVITSRNIMNLDSSKLLKSKKVSREKTEYLLASHNFEVLRSLVSYLEEEDCLINYQLNE